MTLQMKENIADANLFSMFEKKKFQKAMVLRLRKVFHVIKILKK